MVSTDPRVIGTNPRVLIVSHNALSSTQSNGKTMLAFFKNWDRECLAQLYLTTDVPDFSVCERFFQINDFDVLKRVLLDRRVQGRVVTRADIAAVKSYKDAVTAKRSVAMLKKRGAPLVRFARDLMWRLGGYRTRELCAFIDDFDPQAVFFQSSSGVFAFSLVKWICTARNIPLIMQTTDDYVTQMATWDPFSWIQVARLTKMYRWAVFYSSQVIAIGDKMVQEYRMRFGGSYYVAMNSVASLNLPKPETGRDKVRFLYAGNLVLNRWRVLGVISQCLKELDQEQNLKGELHIYSLNQPCPEGLRQLNNAPYSSFNGAVNTEQLNKLKTASDVLVHVEAFDHINRHITRLSISTKIPEYLASGRCIFAVGPDDVASIQYIVEHDLGVAVTFIDKAKIKNALADIMKTPEKRAEYAEKGIGVAKARHNAEKTAEDIKQMIICAVENHKNKKEV